MTNEWKKPAHYRDDVAAEERMFWRGFNRRQHAHYMTAKQEQRAAFRDEVARPEPDVRPINGRILAVIR